MKKNKYKNKFVKYLLEVFVIIIGILGAFWLNSWKANQEKDNLRKEILEQLHSDLKVTLEDLKNDLIIHNIALKSHKDVNDFLNSNTEYSDKLVFDFYWVKEEEYIFPSMTGYENLKSFGTDLISNDSIKNYISLIYNHDYPRLIKGNTLYRDISEYLDSYYRKNFEANNNSSLKYTLTLEDNYIIEYPKEVIFKDNKYKKYIGYHPIDIKKLKGDSEFKYLLSETLKFRLYKCRMYKNCIENVERVINLIKKELKYKISQ